MPKFRVTGSDRTFGSESTLTIAATDKADAVEKAKVRGISPREVTEVEQPPPPTAPVAPVKRAKTSNAQFILQVIVALNGIGGFVGLIGTTVSFAMMRSRRNPEGILLEWMENCAWLIASAVLFIGSLIWFQLIKPRSD